MRTPFRALGVPAFALALSAGSAGAQPFADPGTGVGLLAGASRGFDAQGSSFFASALVLTRLTGVVGVELAAGYRQDHYTGQAAGVNEAGQAIDGAHDLRVWEIPVQLSLLFYLLPNARVQPYLLGGGGYYYVHVTDTGPDGVASTGSSKFGLHVGAGVDVRVSTRLSLRADARYVFLDIDAVSSLSKTADYWQAGIGFNLYF
jgi:outer membrane protein W